MGSSVVRLFELTDPPNQPDAISLTASLSSKTYCYKFFVYNKKMLTRLHLSCLDGLSLFFFGKLLLYFRGFGIIGTLLILNR